jgi:predicted negative regulator of RcsB-dependent stress response
MDKKHRHELEENDLLDFMANFKDWWAKHGNKLLLVVLVVLVGLLGYKLIHQRTVEARDIAERDFSQATSPEALRNLAQNSSDANYQAKAYLRGGDLLLERSRQSGGATPGDAKAAPALTPEQRQENLRNAEAMYKPVLDLDKAHASYKLNARLGLAAVAEDRQQWDVARQQLETVRKDAGEAFPVLAAQAVARQGLLARLQAPVVFAPETQPATQPAKAEAPPVGK